ncbi:hypothetical protein P692DRAFT_20879308 [Suillus brevipes Sb2]|nr:hypothetical protein P692DRAFT_20879308 [Suillus brevipes Sb2]
MHRSAAGCLHLAITGTSCSQFNHDSVHYRYPDESLVSASFSCASTVPSGFLLLPTPLFSSSSSTFLLLLSSIGINNPPRSADDFAGKLTSFLARNSGTDREPRENGYTVYD